MPELPDISLYITALEARIGGAALTGIRRKNPFLLRTAAPPIGDADGRKVAAVRRIGKRIAIGLDGDYWLILHLMIAGRLHWKDEVGANIPGGKNGLAAFDFTSGTLTLRVIAQSGVWLLNQAATRSTSVTSTPSLNFTPVITLVK